jgi:hypothetical protein
MVVVDGGRSFVASEEEEGSSCREKAGDDLRRAAFEKEVHLVC